MNLSEPDFDRLERICTEHGAGVMCEELAASLGRRGRWHAVFDLRLMQARLALGLPTTGGLESLDEPTRERLDELSLAACREVGWPLLEAGQVAAAWMYLRAAVSAAEVAGRLEPLASRALAAMANGSERDEASRLIEEILGVVLWDSVDPVLGMTLVIQTQGTCNAITAFEQAVSRLPASRQAPAAAVLVRHLHEELLEAVAEDLDGRGIATAKARAAEMPLAALLEAPGGLVNDESIHVDVSHLQSVLRIARVCVDADTVRRCYELAIYGCRIPEGVTYPGEPPFENVAEASRHFFGAQLGRDVPAAITYFRRAVQVADPDFAGSLPLDTLVVLLSRLGRPAEALQAAIARPRERSQPSTLQAAGLLPSLVDLAKASGEWGMLLDACRRYDDEVTFATALAAKCVELEPPERARAEA